MLQSAVIPRWWNVTHDQLHWVGLHMALGEQRVAEAGLNAERRRALIAALDQLAPPARVRQVERLLEASDVRAALDSVTPAELFQLAADAARGDSPGLAADVRRLAALAPERLNYAAIGRAFGTPKPTLANSFEPQLLHLRTFPTLMGYSSRILAESWESNLLFYAALADEMHLEPGRLNVLIPAWTVQTVEQIFATHLEDWPALLRSLRGVGEAARRKARETAAPAAQE
jgi:hypothetical protein